ncbi:outer membrane beta-barrel protein [Microbulbifer echini]|uniref:Outer membrane beta-barrel protein n=1 Tax=Microbulbifer echini TaxID=1529067 RepID=A0ABV4NIN0_9GAMM
MGFGIRSLVAVVVLACSTAVQAEGAYVGAVFGVMNTDVSGDDSPLNAGIRAGYSWNSGWGLETELTNSVVEGEFNYHYWGAENYSLATQAIYATYRSEGDIYLKGRLGYLREELEIDHFGEYSDSGASAGIGAGFKLTERVLFETEYTFIESDVDYWSGSLVVRF